MRQKLLHYSRVRTLLERHDTNGRVPFSIAYACLNGAVVNISSPTIVCIGVDTKRRRRTIKAIRSGEIRTIHDCLILRVNDTKIIVS